MQNSIKHKLIWSDEKEISGCLGLGVGERRTACGMKLVWGQGESES